MVRKMSEHADEVLIAGDDDQAIHRWTSVNVEDFINCTDRVEVLNQSYRLPRSVWELAMGISHRMQDRLEKEFFPRQEEGRVTRVMNRWALPLHQGSWTIMARTNSFVNDIAEFLEQEGYFYSRKGHWSVSEKKLEAMSVWEDITTGKGTYVGRVRRLYEMVPKMGEGAVVKRGSIKLLDASAPDELLTHAKLVKDFGMLAPIDTSPPQCHSIIGTRKKIYIRSIERKGESVYKEPRIKISTIHAMKGGEDDNVAVYLGSTKACVESKHPEDESKDILCGSDSCQAESVSYRVRQKVQVRDMKLPDGNVLIIFSGGRTSGYMLHRILKANGDLPDRVKVLFANTGREMPGTLDFVHNIEKNWGVDITWLEY